MAEAALKLCIRLRRPGCAALVEWRWMCDNEKGPVQQIISELNNEGYLAASRIA
jgi:hypothetical protein